MPAVPPNAAGESYVLLTAAYNEEAYIEETIRSVLAQIVRPTIWVIVSDGSTDRTDEIVQGYAKSYSFIHFVRREKDQSHQFASKVFALRAGLRALTLDNTQFIGHLDADLSLGPYYFHDLLRKFGGDPTLGIAGGWYFESNRGRLRKCPGYSLTSVPGGIQTFRRECYEEIGDMVPIEYGGEDWYAEVRARMCGWRVQSFSDLRVSQQRDLGMASSRLRYCYRQGFMDFALGSHPIFELLKLARRITWRPYFVGALARLSGFLLAHVIGRRVAPPEFVTFLRKEQISRLSLKLCSNSRLL